ncbi:MAG: imidazole glycerol phosphate synthase subunit HisH [Acidimicrobiia bacterium]|nr:imidazole glycerol phosphate synthase subunit HisH [Acidimicrobiia bacterium]
MTEPLVAVLDYGIGNLRSAQKGLEHVGADARLTADPAVVDVAAGVVLPGVGAYGRCLEELRLCGLDEVALEAATSGRPFLGICIGMQMLYEGSDESPGTEGLGLLGGRIRALPDSVRRPQMQWNRLEVIRDTPMLDGLDDAWVYFVHSFVADLTDDVVATCSYGGAMTAAVARDNVWATQFHPEKSGANGLRLLSNFVATLR